MHLFMKKRIEKNGKKKKMKKRGEKNMGGLFFFFLKCETDREPSSSNESPDVFVPASGMS